jgi:hypothetical protein
MAASFNEFIFHCLLRLLESEIALDYVRSKTLVPPINETEIYLKVELASYNPNPILLINAYHNVL